MSNLKLCRGVVVPSYLSMCEACSLHGKVIVGQSWVSPAFYSKETGVYIVEELYVRRHILHEDAERMIGQIRESSMPEQATQDQGLCFALLVPGFILLYLIKDEREKDSKHDPHIIQ